MKSDNKKKCGLSAKEMATDKTKNLAIKNMCDGAKFTLSTWKKYPFLFTFTSFLDKSCLFESKNDEPK